MESFLARLNSFKKSKRTKNPDKPSSTVTLKWPHPSNFKANPESLAEAGFYYDPAYDDPDNVTCYYCDKELGGWEEEDDPFLLHWKKCGQQCCWASVRCGLMTELDASGRFFSADKTRQPTHKSMEKARLDTFSAGKGWIHDKLKGHSANSAMMAQAGFVYTPQHSGDDSATCFYCNTSLSGWDEDDDPMEEHRKRTSKSAVPCPFFATHETSRLHSTKPPSKAQVKPSSRSTSKSNYADLVMPTKTFDGEEAESDAAEPAKPTKAPAKTPRKARSTSSSSSKKSSTKTPKAKSRSASRSGLKGVAEDIEEEGEVAVLEPPATVKKKARSKSVVRSDIQSEDDENVKVEPPRTVKKSRSKSKSMMKEVPEHDDENDNQIEPPPIVKKKSRTQSKSITKSDVDAEVQTEQEEIKGTSRSKSRKPLQKIEDEMEEEVLPKPSRPKSKATITSESEETMRKPSRSKAKPSLMPSPAEDVSRKTSRTKSKSKVSDSELGEVPISTEPTVQVEDLPKPAVKTKHHRTASKSKAKASVAVPIADIFPQDGPSNVAKSKTSSGTPLPSLQVQSDDEDEPVIVAQPKKKKAPNKSKPSPPIAVTDVFDDDITHHAPSPPSSSKVASTPEFVPLVVPKRKAAVPTSSEPPSRSITKEKPASKSKPVSAAPKPTKVVEISSDDESDAPKSDKENNSLHKSKDIMHASPKVQHTLQPSIPQLPFKIPPPRPTSSQSKLGKNPIIVETVQPLQATHSPSPKPVEDHADVSMDDVELDSDQRMDVPAPSTPLRPIILLTPPNGGMPNIDPQPEHNQSSTPPDSSDVFSTAKGPLFIPPLSRLPFTPLHTLSDAELDMTVEEWIRYQMEVEFDKFRRDGERELQKFRKKAEDVRKVIEGL